MERSGHGGEGGNSDVTTFVIFWFLKHATQCKVFLS
jgi:hypothetical protein